MVLAKSRLGHETRSRVCRGRACRRSPDLRQDRLDATVDPALETPPRAAVWEDGASDGAGSLPGDGQGSVHGGARRRPFGRSAGAGRNLLAPGLTLRPTSVHDARVDTQ
jgi:hypothetical protein